MRRYAHPHDDAINALATQLAGTVADALDQAGLAVNMANTMALTGALNKEIERVGNERERAVRQSRIERRATWVREQSLLSAGETAQRLGLTLQELETARDLVFIAPVEVPVSLHTTSDHFTRESWQYYLPASTLTDTERAYIAHGTLLTRVQAAERLGVTPATFDHLRVEYGLTTVEPTCEQNGSQINLYRTDAIDQLTAVTSDG